MLQSALEPDVILLDSYEPDLFHSEVFEDEEDQTENEELIEPQILMVDIGQLVESEPTSGVNNKLKKQTLNQRSNEQAKSKDKKEEEKDKKVKVNKRVKNRPGKVNPNNPLIYLDDKNEAVEELTIIDILVCGNCHSTVHFVEEFVEHKSYCAYGKNKESNLHFKTRGRDYQIFAFLLWKAAQKKMQFRRYSAVPSHSALYKKWKTLPMAIKMPWIVAGEALQHFNNIILNNKPRNRLKAKQHAAQSDCQEAAEVEEVEEIIPCDAEEIIVTPSVEEIAQNDCQEEAEVEEIILSDTEEIIVTPSVEEIAQNDCQEEAEVEEVEEIILSDTEEIIVTPFAEEIALCVEKIESRRINLQTTEVEYFVKWKGRPQSENTWEPLSNLSAYSKHVELYENSLSDQIKRRWKVFEMKLAEHDKNNPGPSGSEYNEETQSDGNRYSLVQIESDRDFNKSNGSRISPVEKRAKKSKTIHVNKANKRIRLPFKAVNRNALGHTDNMDRAGIQFGNQIGEDSETISLLDENSVEAIPEDSVESFENEPEVIEVVSSDEEDSQESFPSNTNDMSSTVQALRSYTEQQGLLDPGVYVVSKRSGTCEMNVKRNMTWNRSVALERYSAEIERREDVMAALKKTSAKFRVVPNKQKTITIKRNQSLSAPKPNILRRTSFGPKGTRYFVQKVKTKVQAENSNKSGVR